MNSIKAFFKSKVTKIVAWSVLVLACVILIAGGATAEAISGSVAMVAGIVSAVAALVAFISSKIKE